SGYFFAQSNGFAEINMGFGTVLLCITALILGKTINIKNKMLTITVPLFGIVAYFTLQQTLLKVGFNLKYFTMIQAIAILIILIVQFYKKKKISDQLGV